MHNFVIKTGRGYEIHYVSDLLANSSSFGIAKFQTNFGLPIMRFNSYIPSCLTISDGDFYKYDTLRRLQNKWLLVMPTNRFIDCGPQINK